MTRISVAISFEKVADGNSQTYFKPSLYQFHNFSKNIFLIFFFRKKETQGEADGAEEGGDQDRAGAEQTHLRVHLRVPADRSAELRVHRVPVGGRVRARAPHPRVGLRNGAGHVPNARTPLGRHPGRLELLRRVVPLQELAPLPPDPRRRPQKRHHHQVQLFLIFNFCEC